MSKIVSLPQIKACIAGCVDSELINLMEDGFVNYSKGNVVVPPVGHLPFTNPAGDLHIKYGYIKNDYFYVIKIASGFHENPTIGLRSGNGLMLVLSQKTGILLSILLDEGHLTDIRTALAGAVVAKHLAPKNVTTIGIVGTGIQARLQLKFLKSVTKCKDVIVWGRTEEKLKTYVNDTSLAYFNISTTRNISELTENCNLIVTTTPSHNPLLRANEIKDGTHITAVGADTPGKQELEAALFGKASIITADSIPQCLDHGDICHAVKNKIIDPAQIVELGALILNAQKRLGESDITIADLTGVAIQDIQIAKYVHLKTESHTSPT